jgi:hypothetical protein
MVAAMVFGELRRCEVLGLALEDLRVAQRRMFSGDGKAGANAWCPSSNRSSSQRHGRQRPRRPDRNGLGWSGPDNVLYAAE